MPQDFASLGGRRVRIERGAHSYEGIIDRRVPIWWFAVDGGGEIMISEDGGWTVTPIDEAPTPAKRKRRRRAASARGAE